MEWGLDPNLIRESPQTMPTPSLRCYRPYSTRKSQQQMMGEIHQLKTDRTKEKGSHYDPEHAADKEKTPVGGVLQNAEQRFITMAEVVTFLEQEKARTRKERFCA